MSIPVILETPGCNGSRENGETVIEDDGRVENELTSV